jgi:hypothetical protein
MRSLAFAVAIFVLLLAASPQCDQTDFADVKTTIGEVVYVTASTGVEVGGPIEAISSGLLKIDNYTWQPEDVLRIERRGDRTWDGALIGAGASLMAAGASCRRCYLRWVTFWSAAGWLIDASHVGRTTIYQRPRAHPRRSVISPSLTDRGKGLQLTWSFRRLR